MLERVIPKGGELGINPTYAGHDPLGCSVSYNDQSGLGILMATESNQPQQNIPMGGGQPNHYEQVWRTSWVRKGDRELIKF